MRLRSRLPFWGQVLTKMRSIRGAIAALNSGCQCSHHPPPLRGGSKSPLSSLQQTVMACSSRNLARGHHRGVRRSPRALPTMHPVPVVGVLLALPSTPGGSRTRMLGPRGLRAAGLRRISNPGPGALL
ncbi:hypothetical protein NDU88_006676 [Pleurodeles waltl]|uniref:Uncharacterized protein n=1 Tax=Pleurodeles waltl TaxID=8319 RepID=A0AAV7TZ78_PLEWA|nr:hypothetical protein NDU88_006676 [Pleurodeles waltl]